MSFTLGKSKKECKLLLLTSRRASPKIYYSWQLLCFPAVILTADKAKLSILGETGIHRKCFVSNYNSLWFLHLYVLNILQCVVLPVNYEKWKAANTPLK